MSTPAQIDASRRNGALSNGPRTAVGKARSKRNATTHGLSSGHIILPYEDSAAFAALVFAVTTEFQPQGDHQTFLTLRMAEARWRLQRARILEAAVLTRMIADQPPATATERLAQALIVKAGDPLDKLDRHARSAERSYLKFHRELLAAKRPLADTLPRPQRPPKPQAQPAPPHNPSTPTFDD